jgi:hypothetical protein
MLRRATIGLKRLLLVASVTAAFVWAASAGGIWGPNGMSCVAVDYQEFEQYCVQNPPNCSGACFSSEPYPSDHCVTSTSSSNCNLRTVDRTVTWYKADCVAYADPYLRLYCACGLVWRPQTTYRVTIATCR